MLGWRQGFLGMACSIGVVTCTIQNCRFGTGLLEGNCTQPCSRMTRSGSIVWPLLAKQHLSVKRAARWRRHQKIRTNFVEHKFEEGIEAPWQHSWFKAIPLQKPVQTILNFMFALLLWEVKIQWRLNTNTLLRAQTTPKISKPWIH